MDLTGDGAYDAPVMPPAPPGSATPRIHRSISEARARWLLAGTGWLAWLWQLACAASTPPPATPATGEPAPASAEPPAAAATSTPAPLTATPPEPSGGSQDARGKNEIQAVIAANREKMRACYDAALKNNPGIQGDLVVGFVINPDGTVKSAEVDWKESELHVPELDSCAVDVLRSLKFPPSSRGLESKVNYPFNFNPRKP
jgi:TonB family protein